MCRLLRFLDSRLGKHGWLDFVKQIDRYWDKLFVDPIEVDTPTGKITIQPKRTNNLLEQSFRFMKRDYRKRSGQHSLNLESSVGRV